jgi:gamma-glutamyl-gamma-aminobutyrate hydrolase PuuD
MNHSTGTKTSQILTDLKFVSMYDGDWSGSTRTWLTHCGLKDVRYADNADIIVFNGGADIATSIYGEEVHGSHGGYSRSPRDKAEIEIFKQFPKAFKLGICRGSQLLNCLNGGTLWQDVDRHGRNHVITDTRTHDNVLATSTHHQMMRPGPLGLVLATADESTHKVSEHDTWSSKGGVFFADDHKDTEIVWYPTTRSLCIQGHPEYVPGQHFADYCLALITECYAQATESRTSAA